MQPLKKIKCTNCQGLYKGVIIEIFDDTKGHLRGRCSRCGVYITYDSDTDTITSIENPKSKIAYPQ